MSVYVVPRVKVWNDHTSEYVEQYEGKTVRIPAKGYVVMEKPEASAFLGKYTPVSRDGMGRDLKPKMLRIERIAEDEVAEISEPAEDKTYSCMMCSKEFKTDKELRVHSLVEHEEAIVDEEAKPKRGRPRKNPV